MDLDQFQPIVSGVLLVVGIVAASFAGVQTGNNKTLRETVSDRGVRITDLEGEVARKDAAHAEEIARKDADLARKDTELAEANNQIRFLNAMKTGRIELTALGDLMEDHHRQALIHWGQIDGHITELPAQLARVIKEEDR